MLTISQNEKAMEIKSRHNTEDKNFQGYNRNQLYMEAKPGLSIKRRKKRSNDATLNLFAWF